MVTPHLHAKAAAALLLFLTGCAGHPVAEAFTLPPGIDSATSTYSIGATDDGAAKAALPFVDQQLRRRGFRPSASPDLIVTVAVTARGRDVGAYSADGCSSSRWVQNPGRKWLAGGGRVMGLQVVMIDARTKLPVYRSSASMRTDGGPADSYVGALAEAALRDDPRRAPSCAAAS